MGQAISRASLFGRRAAPQALATEVAPGNRKASVTSRCLSARGVYCRTCEDPCEAGAIRFCPMPGGRSVPLIDPAVCTGCGACVAPCPAGAIALIALSEDQPSCA
ncbi:MAG TPA: 4Fe-4S binding protein [Azospirillaceae bacterium]|nr:4Fe-4S binding protein [Azospirillaceae bacterium]